MNNKLSLITCNDEKILASTPTSLLFWQQSKSLFVETASADGELLVSLASRIAQKPTCLLTHIQRIYYCYQARLDAQLYAALVDFLIILNKRGLAISRRMVTGTKSALNVEQFAALVTYLQAPKMNHQLLPGNRYSIFSSGIIGTTQLAKVIEDTNQIQVDALSLARDFIEYSQLSEAQTVLESAILAEPDRLELQAELLELYQSTRNAIGFNQMLKQLTDADMDVPDAWQQLSIYFKGLNNVE
jgi:hypothetical protein